MPTLNRHDAVLIILGAAWITLGIVGRTFYPGLPGPRKRVKPLPPWLGRIWFIGLGALAVYIAVRR
jgi:hypothetical protein